ncbi:MAG TPA: hypothetical protein PKC21_00840 [Oligoflexia bacterium]|nr:hypothetical protein [Oligoflexia bacterium]HMR23875.1 hypothetical protein [Oligoflexia bacterium]
MKRSVDIFLFVTFLLALSVFAKSNSYLNFQERRQLFKDELQFNDSHEVLRYASSHLHQHEYYYGSSGDLFEQFVQFLFPLTGRENRIMFMPLSAWGPKKPQYKKFDWQRYESQHFVFYYDKNAYSSFKKAHAFLEDDFARNNEIFSVRNKFLKKIPIIIYQSRKDFEQTNIVSGPVPEGLGGVTEIFSWKRAVFPFEGEMSTFEHVTKHEGTHIYQIAKGAKNLPLWFIEGSAETNSIYWDADAEQFIRDAYLNDLFFDIDDLWQIRGTWLMYKIGNYICNFIREKYGERALQKIYQNSVSLNFNENIKLSLGVSLQELNRMVQASLSMKYGYLYKKNNPYDKALKVQKRSVVLHAYKNFFISGKGNGSSNALYINYIDEMSKVHKKKIISDKKLNSESLNYFRKGAWLNESSLVYSIKNGSHDEIRLLNYTFDKKKKRFKFDKKPHLIRFQKIRSIFSPVIVGDNKVVFIGIKNGFSNIYQYNYIEKKLEQITKDSAHYSNLDYSAAKNTIIFSKELERSQDRIYYNRDIFEYDLKTQKIIPITQTSDIRENNPRYSISGTNIIFSSDEDETHNLYLYNTLTRAKQKLTNHPSGIKTAVWSQNESLLLNVNNRFVSDIVHMPLPKPFDMLNNEINFDSSKSISVFSENNAYIYSPKNLDEKTTEIEVEFNSNKKITTGNNNTFLQHNDQKFKVQKIAAFENELFIQATNINDDKKRIQSLEDKILYFRVNKNTLESIYDPVIQKDSSSKSINQKISKILKDKVIISVWEFKDTADALVLVNEKLSTQDKSQNNSKAITNLYSCDLEKNNCEVLRGSRLENFKKDIFWVAKLEGGSYLWTLSENKNGPYEIFLYDHKLKKTIKVGNEVLRFKVAETQNSFSMLVGSDFIVYDFSEEKGWTAKQYEPNGSIIGYDFLKKSNDFMILTSHKKHLNIHLLKKDKTVLKKVKHSINNLVLATINKKTGDFVVYAKSQNNSEMIDKLYYYDKKTEEFYDISIRGKLKTFDQVVFIDDFLVFTGKNFSYEKSETWVWKNKERRQLKNIIEAKSLNDNQSWVVNLENDLYLLQFDNDKYKKIVSDSFGFDVHSKKVFYASTNNEKYNIYQYDVDLDKNSLLIASKNHAFKPKFFKNKLYYQSYDGKVINVREYVSDKNQDSLAFSLKKHHVVMDASNENLKRMRFDLLPYQESIYSGPELTSPKSFPIENSSKPAKDIYKLQSLLAAAAYDGNNFRILLNGYVDNIFSDKGAFVNLILLGENKFAVFGVSNLRNATSASVFYNDRENIQNYGINFSKRFNLDRYRAFNILTELERQVYGESTPDTLSYVDSDVENKSFNVVKLSSTYDHDVTLWDRHGPISGSRVFFRLSSGLDLTEQRLAYYSGNADVRFYNSILNKFSLAHRLSAGSSQGALPEVYLAGGNISFRGVNFDDLQGQNYAIFSEDVRLPLFDFIGAKFFDPLDSFVGFLTRFFDVRTGAFIDVGDVWYNNEDFELMYASGFFANVPSLLGVNLRFHYSVWGKQGFGFWIGSNW